MTNHALVWRTLGWELPDCEAFLGQADRKLYDPQESGYAIASGAAATIEALKQERPYCVHNSSV